MKTTLLLLTLSLFFYSCKKCATCTTTVTTQKNNYVVGVEKNTFEACGDYLKAVDNQSSVNEYQDGLKHMYIVTETKCK